MRNLIVARVEYFRPSDSLTPKIYLPRIKRRVASCHTTEVISIDWVEFNVPLNTLHVHCASEKQATIYNIVHNFAKCCPIFQNLYLQIH